MPGKYSDIQRPKEPVEMSPYQKLVEAEKSKFVHLKGDAPKLASFYVDWKRKKDEHDDAEKVINLKIAALESLLCETFETQGLEKIVLEDGASVAIFPEPTAKIEDMEVFNNWCRENGYEKLMRLLPQTVNGIVKERLLEGQDEPPGVKAFMRDKVQVRGR